MHKKFYLRNYTCKTCMMNSKSVKIHLEIGDQLTAISCGNIVSELIKFLTYQRLQIPYTYQWLKQIVTQRRSQQENLVIKESFQSQRHFKTAASALESLDFVLKSLLQEINGPLMPEEVCITLGASPLTCKEVYRILLPVACHKPQCHSTLIGKDQKLQSHIFRKLVTSTDLTEAFSGTLAPTNMHVFIRKKVTNNLDIILNDSNFVPASGSRIPKSTLVVLIDLRSSNNISCCSEFQIFGDNSEELKDEDDRCSLGGCDMFEIQSTDTMKWFQSTYVMKGFKDCVFNGSSVTNTWLQ